MDRKEKAISFFNNGYNCAQSVFTAYCDLFGIDEKLAKKIATGFGGGFGRLQMVCGAVSGAVMLIGCKYYDEKNIRSSKELVYQKTREFIEEFEKKNKGIECLELIGVDFSKENGLKIAKEKNLFKLKCENYIREACDIIEKIIE